MQVAEPRDPWHVPDPQSVVETLGVDPQRGLDDKDVARRRLHAGYNRLTPRKGKGPFALFLAQFHDPLIYILLASGIITGVLKGWVDASVILAVVFINAVIGFIQEMNALRAIDALSRAQSLGAAVLRSGSRQSINAEELVPGDIVFLQSGDKVPADIRLLRLRDLQIDESTLTGESVPVEKNPGPLHADTLLADRSNMAYASTLVSYGTGVGAVVATGDSTEIGRINQLLGSVSELETPLTRKIGELSGLLLWFIVGLAAVSFVVGWLHSDNPVDTFVASVALAVAAIPEGLPVAVTIALAIGVRRMARRHAIIRKLPAVETLGSVTVICSDKTGTLTQNQMTVQSIATGEACFQISGSGYAPIGEFSLGQARIDPAAHPGLMETLKAGLLCNDARLVADDGEWRIEGDPTEGALLVSAHKAGLKPASVEASHPRLDSIPFESEHQFMATLHHNRAAEAHHIYIKGSVESILARCVNAFDGDLAIKPLDAGAIQRDVDAMAGRGLRVLAFARGERPTDDHTLEHEEVAQGLSFLGLQGMIDPPRAEAVRAVAACQQAGIRVKMITGDHLGTAVAIAGQIGLSGASDGPVEAIDGKTLATVAERDLPDLADRTAVFARVAPEQKLRLVEALQAHGHVVAMTGDGVNDAPALRQANIGVAMGITGTEVSKEAAAMVLTDDNFSSIRAAVEEGRGVYDNLVKFITWTLPTNLGQGAVVLIAIVADIALPMLPVQILWVNMTTAVFLGLTLAFEAKEPDVMQRPPRDPNQPLLTRHLMGRTLLVGLLLCAAGFGLFEWEMTHEDSIEKARTAAVNAFILGQVFYLLSCRSLTRSQFQLGVFSNPWIWVGIAGILAAQAAFNYLPAMNWLFHSAPTGREEWLLATAAGLLIHVIVGAEKFVSGRWLRRSVDAPAGR